MRFYQRRMKGIDETDVKVEPKWLGMGEYVNLSNMLFS